MQPASPTAIKMSNEVTFGEANPAPEQERSTIPSLPRFLNEHVLHWGFWSKQFLWPQSSRHHIFLADAVCRVGQALFPDEWHDNDTLTKKQESLHPSGAHGRLLKVIPWIAEHARDGDFDTLFYDEKSMALTRQSSTVWVRPDVLTAYFQTCRFTPMRSSLATDTAPFIFFDGPAFETAIAQQTCRAPSAVEVQTSTATSVGGATNYGRKSDRTGAPGRPSSMHIFENLLKQRSAAGTMLPELRAQAKELLSEFSNDQSHIGLRTPTLKTVENSIRELYWKLLAKAPK